MNKNITMRITRFEGVKTSLLGIFITLLVVIGCFIAILIIEKNFNKEENLTTLEGYVVETSIDEDDDKLLFKLNTYDYVFNGFLRRDEVKELQKVLNTGDYVEVLVTKKRLDQESTPIIKLKLNGVDFVDLTDENARTNKGFFIATCIMLSLSIALLITYLILRRKVFMKEVNYYEHILPLFSMNYINKENKSYKELEKRNLKYIFGYFIFVVALCISIAFLGEAFPDYPHIIIPIVVIAMGLSTYLLFKKVVLYKSTDENIKEFVKLFKGYLNNEVDFSYANSRNPYLSEEGLIISDEEDYDEIFYNDEIEANIKEVIPYSDLEFYVACVYKNNFHYVNIFICRDDYETNTPYFFELSPKTYEQIKEYNINVNNLDYVLNNLENEIVCNKPKIKTKVVLYK